jgi:hypothetical protein
LETRLAAEGEETVPEVADAVAVDDYDDDDVDCGFGDMSCCWRTSPFRWSCAFGLDKSLGKQADVDVGVVVVVVVVVDVDDVVVDVDDVADGAGD